MKIDIITLFPEMFSGPFDESIVRIAQEQSLVEINFHNLRQWAVDKHGTVDDKPYGGGIGMVLRPEPIFNAVKDILAESNKTKEPSRFPLPASTLIVLLSASGAPYTQQKAFELSKLKHLIFICGRYEGVDQRVSDYLADEEISIGDYVLTGGEIPAMVIVDSVVRLLPGVLEKDATENESFSSPISLTLDSQPTSHPHPLLEYPHYTRPEVFKRHKAPKVLLSGNHKEIEKWRQEKALEKTKKVRPELFK